MTRPACVVVALLSLLVTSCWCVEYTCPEECTCSHRDSPDLLVDVFCSLSTVHDNSNFALFRTSVNSTLHLECDPQLHSHLRSRMFQDLHTFSALTFENCKFDHIPKDLFVGMSLLKILTVINARKLTFDPKAFSSASSLTRLTVVASEVSVVPSLCENKDLVYVNFTNNKIRSMADAGLACENSTLLSLSRIVLPFNEFEYLGNELSSTAPNLWELGISNNRIMTIHRDAFWSLNDLGWLDLSSNRLRRLPPYLLRKQENLQIIALNGNNLGRVPEGFFGYSTKLRVVTLGDCNMDDRIWTELWPLREMTELQLQNNNISKLDRESLLRFEKLFYLDLSGNRIRYLSERFFEKQLQLEKLKLGKNKIENIDRHAFEGLTSLLELDLRNNNISQADNESLLPLQSVSQLNISFNFLSEIPCLKTMEHVNLIDFRFNRIDTLDLNTFEGLPTLKGISLAFNNIRVVPRGVFNKPPSLQILNLAYNDIDVIEDEAFHGASELRWMFLQHNNVSDVTWAFSSLYSLLHLDLSYNAIANSVNGEQFPKSLQEINLANNKITSVADYAFYNFKNLRKVDIRYNLVQTLKLLSISVSPALQGTPPTFYIAGNPFVCDCKLQWLRKKMEESRPSYGQPIIYDMDVILCHRGFEAQNKLLYKLEPSNMLCNYYEECLMSKCRCCEFQGCVCRFVCPHRCTCFRSLDHSTTNFVKCSRENLTSIPSHIPSVSTQFWLDGNNFSSLTRFGFLGLEFLRILYLNNSDIESIQNGSFVGLKSIEVLNLDGNYLEDVLYGMFYGLENLVELNLENNRISFIDYSVFEHTPNIQRLYLANNQLKFIVDATLSNPMWHRLSLAGNPWSCDCNFLSMMLYNTNTIVEKIVDRRDLECVADDTDVDNIYAFNSRPNRAVNFEDVDMEAMCPNVTLVFRNLSRESLTRVLDRTDNLPLICAIVAIVVVVVVLGLVFWHKNIIQVLCFAKFGCRMSHEKSDVNQIYDAFISYSHKDEDFVIRELVPRLEDVDHRFKLCVHYRDFPIGASISETIVRSVECSRRTILIMSDNFLKSEWCQYEFQTAHSHVLQDRTNRLIIILLSDVNVNEMSSDLKLYLQTRTYVKYSDPWFWEKLYYAMPDIKHRVTPIDRILDIRPEVGVGNTSSGLPDDEGYETPISRVSSVHRHTCDFGHMTEAVANFNIYEEIHPVEKSEKQMA
ncbi:toll-like receptor Tollo [Mizuhopecten yessoensis]|uniref:Protein toll n=1 Tax=Mizuhopecten yessoensis TaxID=6573 RepID=A0A210QFQ3_MIZYE|nr:toll-like receptor Tollo [Mizuhopecten yessoensis]OWF47576.1 Protein toll [Mizuhopecten yessoensis]